MEKCCGCIWVMLEKITYFQDYPPDYFVETVTWLAQSARTFQSRVHFVPSAKMGQHPRPESTKGSFHPFKQFALVTTVTLILSHVDP